MAARITRAKKKIATARIPYRVPAPADLPERVDAVLEVIHLVSTTGHDAPSGDGPRAPGPRRLGDPDGPDAPRAAPRRPGVTGLLALVLLADARRATRLTDGDAVAAARPGPLRWDRARSPRGRARDGGARRWPPGRYALQAALAAVHAEAPSWAETDWAQIVGLYDLLVRVWPSPVVRLNRAVAVGLRTDRGRARETEPLRDEPALSTYPYLRPRAPTPRRLERWDDAAAAYEEALLLAGNGVERAFLVPAPRRRTRADPASAERDHGARAGRHTAAASRIAARWA